MRTLWRKALRDLYGERVRSASIVLALALGIAGFLAVLSAYAILTRALNDGYRATNPASATLHVERLDDELVSVVRALPGIESAEARRTVRGRIRTGPAQWRNLVLFARRDFAASRIGMVWAEGGSWPPGAGELALERDAFQVAQASVGDVVTVRTERGNERALRISGAVHDVGQAQARMENLVYGYATLETLASLGEEPFYDELALRVAERPLDEAYVNAVVRTVAAAIEASGRRVERIDVPKPGEHPHARLMGLLLLSMAVFGLFVLVLAGTIVFNVLTALLAGQTRQIGVMKALGGTRFAIARVYLLEAGLLGAAAVTLALPIGLVGGRWLCRWLAVFLNFDVESFALPAWVYLLVLAVGMAVPILAALVPVWLGTRVSVRDALAPSGPAHRAYGSSAIDRALTRVGGSSRVLLLALRNASRSRLRVALTLVTLAAGGAFFLSALNLRQAMIATLDRLFATQRADLTLSLVSDYPLDAVERAAREVPGVVVAEGWRVVDGELPRPGGELAAEPGAARKDFSVTGLAPGTTLVAFDFASGAGLDGGAADVVVNTELFERLGRPAIGDELRLRIAGRDAALRLAGVAREPYSPPAAYVSRAFFDADPEARTANSLRIALASSEPASLDAARTAVEARLENAGIRAVQANSKGDTRFVFDQHMRMVYVFLLVVAGILGGVGALGLVTTMGLNVSERRREMGVLRALGATPARVAQIVVIEGVLVGLLAALIAAATAAPLGKLVGDFLLGTMFRAASDIPVQVEPIGVAAWLVLSLAGSALASLWPARQAARASVREALTYE